MLHVFKVRQIHWALPTLLGALVPMVALGSDPCSFKNQLERAAQSAQISSSLVEEVSFLWFKRRRDRNEEIDQLLLKRRKRYFDRFDKTVRPKSVREFEVEPASVDARYWPSYRRMLKLVQSPEEIFTHLQQLEKEVWLRVKFFGSPKDRALREVLEKWEKSEGFGDVIELREFLDESDFLEKLKAGRPIEDAANRYRAHGGLTHRIQLHLVMRDMRANPQFYVDPDGTQITLVELYRQAADPARVRGSENLWISLFDSFSHDISNPEVLRDSRKYWDLTGSWR